MPDLFDNEFISGGQFDTPFNGMPWRPSFKPSPGRRCECCDSFLKIYRRNLSTTMSRSLVLLYRLHESLPEQEFFHISRFGAERTGGDFAKTKFWGFTLEKINEDTTKRTSGMWRVTELGKSFILGQIQAPKYIVMKWNSTHLGFSGPMKNFRQCLEYKNRFRYDELMGYVPEAV